MQLAGWSETVAHRHLIEQPPWAQVDLENFLSTSARNKGPTCCRDQKRAKTPFALVFCNLLEASSPILIAEQGLGSFFRSR